MLTQPFSVSSPSLSLYLTPSLPSSLTLSARIRAKVRLSIRSPLPLFQLCLFDLAMCSHCIFVVSVAMFRTDTSSQSSHFLPPRLLLPHWVLYSFVACSGVDRAACNVQRSASVALEFNAPLRGGVSSSTCISGPPRPLAFYAIFYLLLS